MTSWLLQVSIPLSVLLLLLLAAHRFLLKPLGARNLYALWAVVPLLLILSLLPIMPELSSSTEAVKRYQVGLQQLTTAAGSVNWLFWCWLAGGVACLSWLVLTQFSVQQLFKTARPVKVSGFTLPCWQSGRAAGPYISGFIKPRILLPDDFFTRFEPQQQQLILQHELTHWQRGDLHLNYLALLLLTLFWFNPLSWLAYRQYRQTQELACDAVVTSNASNGDKIAYGYALLSSARQPSAYWWPLAHHYGDFTTMKQRLIQLQRQQGLSKTLVLAAMALVLGASLMLQQPALAGADKATQLTPVSRVEPRYPLAAAQQGIAGYVQIQFDVDAQGNVINADVIKAVPEQVFAKEALFAVQQWKYTATGQLHKAQRVQLDFELDTTPADMERINVTLSQKKPDQSTD